MSEWLLAIQCCPVGDKLVSSGDVRFMKPDEYWFVIHGSVSRLVCIKPGRLGWAICLDDVLIEDGFPAPEEAALCASKKDVPDDRARQLFGGIWVPSDLNVWRTSKPETPFIYPSQNN